MKIPCQKDITKIVGLRLNRQERGELGRSVSYIDREWVRERLLMAGVKRQYSQECEPMKYTRYM